jgi:hypothetical protein
MCGETRSGRTVSPRPTPRTNPPGALRTLLGPVAGCRGRTIAPRPGRPPKCTAHTTGIRRRLPTAKKTPSAGLPGLRYRTPQGSEPRPGVRSQTPRKTLFHRPAALPPDVLPTLGPCSGGRFPAGLPSRPPRHETRVAPPSALLSCTGGGAPCASSGCPGRHRSPREVARLARGKERSICGRLATGHCCPRNLPGGSPRRQPPHPRLSPGRAGGGRGRRSRVPSTGRTHAVVSATPGAAPAERGAATLRCSRSTAARPPGNSDEAKGLKPPRDGQLGGGTPVHGVPAPRATSPAGDPGGEGGP